MSTQSHIVKYFYNQGDPDELSKIPKTNQKCIKVTQETQVLEKLVTH